MNSRDVGTRGGSRLPPEAGSDPFSGLTPGCAKNAPHRGYPLPPEAGLLALKFSAVVI